MEEYDQKVIVTHKVALASEDPWARFLTFSFLTLPVTVTNSSAADKGPLTPNQGICHIAYGS